MITREPIYAALFAKLQSVPGIVTASRRIRHFTQVKPQEMPALFQTQIMEKPAVQRGIPTRYNLAVEVTLFIWQQNATDAITPTLNPLLDGIEYALRPDNVPQTECTLGGLVSHCRIDGGAVEIFEGMNEGKLTVAILPVQIMVA